MLTLLFAPLTFCFNNPYISRSTELITDEDMTSASPTSVLGRLLPSGAIRVIFGQEDTITKQKAMEQSQSRSSTLLTVYLVSTNDDQARKVTMCFSEIPSRVFAMQPDDFFTLDQGRYESMGMDRLACMRAAGDMMGFPALVFDGGTCMTYTACDSRGSLVGGGITLGLMAKFAAVSQCSRYAPGMSSVQHHEDMVKYAHDMVLQNKPLDFFSRNTQEAVVSSTLKETAFYCRQVVSKYLTDVFSKFKEIDGKVDDSGDAEKRIPKIIVAGGDSVILQKLLENESNYLLDPNPDTRPYSIVEFKHLIAFGIAIALKAKVEKHKSQAITDFDRLLLGCRVAKEFKTLDEDGDRIYRGTIAASVRTSDSEEHQYLVLYDDIDTEEMNLVELHGKSGLGITFLNDKNSQLRIL
jgi:pantothenate kinase type III